MEQFGLEVDRTGFSGYYPRDTTDLSYCARMINTKTGWTLTAHGLVQYEDGTIEWDYSTGGYFGEVPA